MSNTNNLLLLQLYRINSLIKETEQLVTIDSEVEQALHNAKLSRMDLQSMLCWKPLKTSLFTTSVNLN